MKDLNISVVIPNYNGVRLFPDTLPALFNALAHLGRESEVIIVDDCSTDESIQYIRSKFPEITLLLNTVNSGFSKTINKGIHAAKHDLVLLLNSDVKLSANYFEAQLKYFQMADTFGVMGKIIGWDDDQVQDTAKYPKFQGFKLKTSANYDPKVGDEQEIYSLYLSGANALVDRVKLLQLGGFDEIYSPFYMEDVDLSVRAWRIGWKCYFESESVCRHRTSTSIASKEKRQYVKKIYNRNKMFFHAIHLNGAERVGCFVQTLLELLFRTIFFQFHYLHSFLAFRNSGAEIRQSRAKFLQLSAKAGQNLSLRDICLQIKRGIFRESRGGKEARQVQP